MEQFMPLQMLKNNFKAKIHKLQLISKDDNVTFYEALTSYGNMTLIVQSFLCTSQKGIKRQIQERNSLMLNQSIVTPLIYEQQIIKMRDDYIICMSLCQSIVLCDASEIIRLQAESLFENIVKCAYSMSKTTLTYQLECYYLKTFIKSTHNSTFFLNFTKIVLQNSQKPCSSFQIFKSSLCLLMQQCRKDKIQQILFICQYPFVFNLQKISECRNWFDLAMMFNLLMRQNITVITELRTKVFPINRLSGVNKLEYNGIIYQGFTFRDGFRTDGTREITFDELKSRFFEDQMIYYMTKEKYMCVRKEPIEKEEQWIVNKIQYEDLILVKPQISKVQFINFLIAYIKFIQPILHQINFYAEENILQLVFTSKIGKIRKIAIKFHSKYVVKDEELSMIIEKSKLKKVSMSLQRMSFGDSFLIFLANCDKMLQVKSFNISHCSKITESGINLLIGSPMCKNMQVLKISSLPLPDFQLVKTKMKLKELNINNCITFQPGEQVYLGQINMERLQGIGLNIDFKLSQNLKFLYLSQDTSMQQLRLLKDFALVELKIKLVDNKKMITSFFNTLNNFYSKDNPLKLFCEGKAKKTLKYLDVSQSTVKLKDIKSILYIQSLQILICDKMERDKFIDIILPHHIVTLSLQDSKVTADILQEMTQRINFFIRLNIYKTDINERTLEQSIKGKKYINLLQIGEEQIDLNFFSKKTCIEGLQVHLHRLIRDDNQPILNFILFKQITICKELNFICESKYQPRLVAKINRFLNLYQDKLRKIANQLTLNVNSISIMKLIRLKPKEQTYEHFTVVNKKAANHKIKINSRTLLAQQYRLPMVDEYLNIDLFNVILHKVIHIFPNSLLQICIRSNRILDKNTICLLQKYAGNRLLSLDFRNCLFSYSQVQQQLYQFPYLQSVNEGEYQIALNEEQQCQHELQKILKFFMKVRQDKMKLRLSAVAISERQLYFSIISEIMTHHASNLVLLDIKFENIPLESHSVLFWRQIFLLTKLQTLRLHYNNDFATSVSEQMQMAIEFEKLNNLSLFSLEIETNIHLAIPQQLSFPNIHRLSITYSQMDISETTVFKLLRTTPTLTNLTLNLQGSTITSLHKISDSIQKMPNLAYLCINLQNTTVKEYSLLELIENLHKNTHLQRLDLNVNNCVIGINELVKACQNLVNRIKFCHICIAALQAKKPNYLVDQAELLAMGIQIIFTV